MTRFATIALTPALFLAASSAYSAPVMLLPGAINGGDTSTVSFSNSDVALTPLVGNTPNTFNSNATRLGIDENGTNANSFNDIDTDPNNGNEERLQIDFSANAGLSQFTYDFSRAQVAISGFLFDPASTNTGETTGVGSITYSAGTVSFFQSGAGFNDNEREINFNPLASAGQTLLITVTDPSQAGAQLAITSITYNDAVPEPSSLALIGLGGLMIARRRRG